jgi:hypothetical protein
MRCGRLTVWAGHQIKGQPLETVMAKFARFFVLLTSAVVFAGMVPQAANAQVVVRVGHRYHHHYYYRHGHRYYR